MSRQLERFKSFLVQFLIKCNMCLESPRYCLVSRIPGAFGGGEAARWELMKQKCFCYSQFDFVFLFSSSSFVFIELMALLIGR